MDRGELGLSQMFFKPRWKGQTLPVSSLSTVSVIRLRSADMEMLDANPTNGEKYHKQYKYYKNLGLWLLT